jgi:hypothetical protein
MLAEDYYSDISDSVDYFILECNVMGGHWAPAADMHFNLQQAVQTKIYFHASKYPMICRKLECRWFLIHSEIES